MKVKNLILLFLLTSLSLRAQESFDQIINEGIALHDQGKYDEAKSNGEVELNWMKENEEKMNAFFDWMKK